MTRPNVVDAIVEALRNADATDETIAVVLGAAGAFQAAPKRQRGRKRQHADSAERLRAWRRRNEIRNEIAAPDALRNEIRNETRNEIPDGRPPAGFVTLWDRIQEVAAGHFDPEADMAPILVLLNQGCDLEADILPIIARDVPTLGRPLEALGRPVACA